MSLVEGSYSASLPLANGETATLVNTYGEEVDTYTSVYSGTYTAKYDNEKLSLTTKEGDTILEAEDGCLDGKFVHFFEHNEASGRAVVVNINDAGQGITLFHYSYFEGTYDVQVGYYTDMPGGQNYVYINDVHQATVSFNEKTGWAPDVSKAAAVTDTCQVTFQKGWNKIEVIKDGTKENEYGGWTQLDYVKVLGSNREMDPTTYSKTENLTSFKIEAEQGLTNHTYVSNGQTKPHAPHNGAVDSASKRYFRGSFDWSGAKVDFRFRAPVAGKYDLQLGYANAGNAAKTTIYVNGVAIEQVTQMDSYPGNAWNYFNPNPNSHKTRIELSDTKFDTITVELNEGWYCFDYILLTYVGE